MKSIVSIFIFLFLISSQTAFSQNCNEENSIVSVYKTKNSQYEYVIFKVKNDFKGSYTISDEPTPLKIETNGPSTINKTKGCSFKRIKFSDINWMCVVPISSKPSTKRITAVKKIEQFEGIISFLVGYNCPASKYVGHYSYNDGGYEKVVLKFRIR